MVHVNSDCIPCFKYMYSSLKCPVLLQMLTQGPKFDSGAKSYLRNHLNSSFLATFQI